MKPGSPKATLKTVERIRSLLAGQVLPAAQLVQKLGISHASLSRAIACMRDEVLRFGNARATHYALRDTSRGLPTDIPVYRVGENGRLSLLANIFPVRPHGFVVHRDHVRDEYCEGLPWWLFDLRPQGYLGRAFVARYAAELNLPARVNDWQDQDTLRAALYRGDDLIGNLLTGDAMRAAYLAVQSDNPFELPREGIKEQDYPKLARIAAAGGVPGSSAGGEQPKFCCYAQTASGPRHVLVKFSEPEVGSVPERWRDLLLAEHLALMSLNEAGVTAARSQVMDYEGQRFLEVERFDRVGESGRRALYSLAALDAEFVGLGENWLLITDRLLAERLITPEAQARTALLWAFGTLIGNTDMHSGNLSFTGNAFPLSLAPAYDMTPMAFAPLRSGALPSTLAPANLSAPVPADIWQQALLLARQYLKRLSEETGFSPGFAPCVAALQRHLADAAERMKRLEGVIVHSQNYPNQSARR